jgi:hypothetical protein
MAMPAPSVVGGQIQSALDSASAGGQPPDPATTWTSIVEILQTMIKAASISVTVSVDTVTPVTTEHIGLQTTTAPGAPTGPPAVPVPLAGTGGGNGTGTITG